MLKYWGNIKTTSEGRWWVNFSYEPPYPREITDYLLEREEELRKFLLNKFNGIWAVIVEAYPPNPGILVGVERFSTDEEKKLIKAVIEFFSS